MADIAALQNDAWTLAEQKGLHGAGDQWSRELTFMRLCLIHTEISEAAQEVKRHWSGKPTGEQLFVFGEELADTVIRILDLAECVGVDLDEAVRTKMIKNWNRPYKFGTPQEGKSV